MVDMLLVISYLRMRIEVVSPFVWIGTGCLFCIVSLIGLIFKVGMGW